MKPLYGYITEALTREKLDSKYELVVLLTHDRLDCATMTATEFARLMKKDLKVAWDEYVKAMKPVKEQRLQAYIEDAGETAARRARRQFPKDEEKIEAARESGRKWGERYYKDKIMQTPDITFLMWPEISNGCPGACVLEAPSTPDSKLKDCFEKLQQDCKYWPLAKGWRFTYKAPIGGTDINYHAYVDLILDKSVAKELEKYNTDKNAKDMQQAHQALSDWYSSLPPGAYTGD